jgi:hypothetical protein
MMTTTAKIHTGELLSHSPLTGKFYIVTKWLVTGTSDGMEHIEALVKREATDDEVADWPHPESVRA